MELLVAFRRNLLPDVVADDPGIAVVGWISSVQGKSAGERNKRACRAHLKAWQSEVLAVRDGRKECEIMVDEVFVATVHPPLVSGMNLRKGGVATPSTRSRRSPKSGKRRP